MIRVLLVDDHPVVRTGYRRLLEQAGDISVVAEAACVDEACAAFADVAPEVSVTDLSMPGTGGLELIRRLLADDAAARILVFSMHDGASLVRRALEAGARGFLSKSAAPDSLVDAVRVVRTGRRYLSPDLPRWLLDSGPHDEARRLESLSQREFEIFRLLAEGCSAAECAAALGVSQKTVANHQTLIREKLGIGTAAGLVHLALRHGVIDIAQV